jgi:hypothetical protein
MRTDGDDEAKRRILQLSGPPFVFIEGTLFMKIALTNETSKRIIVHTSIFLIQRDIAQNLAASAKRIWGY